MVRDTLTAFLHIFIRKKPMKRWKMNLLSFLLSKEKPPIERDECTSFELEKSIYCFIWFIFGPSSGGSSNNKKTHLSFKKLD